MSSDVVVVFPGQGSQRDGMGADFVESYDEARSVFERASQALGYDVAAVCHQDDDRLNLTEFTQPCIVTVEIAMLEALKSHESLSPTIFAGHSLGEYTALVAAGAIPFESAVRLVQLRGQLMQKAVEPGLGAMVAVVKRDGLPIDTIRECAAKHDVDVANENSPAQVVLSGEKEPTERAVAAIEAAAEGIRPTWLNVSAPFHSRHMKGIEDEFRAALQDASGDFDASKASAVLSNTMGGFHTGELDSLIGALTSQISGSVLWTDNMKAIMEKSETIYEVGPHRPLRGFFSALGGTVTSIMDLRSAARAFPKE
ncbi:MAG: acyltransferase domain-containing protein [Planctomycetota bacterium]